MKQSEEQRGVGEGDAICPQMKSLIVGHHHESHPAISLIDKKQLYRIDI